MRGLHYTRPVKFKGVLIHPSAPYNTSLGVHAGVCKHQKVYTRQVTRAKSKSGAVVKHQRRFVV